MARRITALRCGARLRDRWPARSDAQERFGSVTGTVTDTTEAAVPGATVTVTNKETGATARRGQRTPTGRTACPISIRAATRSRSSCRAFRRSSSTTHRPARQDADRRCRAAARRADGSRERHGGRDQAARPGERDARAQRHRRGVRPAAEGPQLPEHRDGRTGRELRRDRGRLPGQRREQRRERLHHRRRGDQQLDLRELAAEHRVRVPAGSAGQDRRHRRRIRRRARRRDQRGDQVRRQHCSPAKATTTTSAARSAPDRSSDSCSIPNDLNDGRLLPGRQAGQQPERVRRLDRRSDREEPPLLLRLGLAARRPADQRVHVLVRHRAGHDRSGSDGVAGLRQGDVLGRASARQRQRADDADALDRPAAGLRLDGHRTT